MKKYLFSLMLIAAFGSNAATFAQSEIVVGDMNDDGQLTVGDVTALSETVIGHKAVRRISVAGDPYAADNSSIVGRWSGVSGTITFNSDGTTDYKDGYTYEYLPAQCLIVFYDETLAAKEFLEVVILKSNKLILSDAAMTKAYTYDERLFVAEDGTIYNGEENGHRYVDLGLSSSTLWATCNVGANSPEEYGDYFAWGEVEPKITYNWSTYKYHGDYYRDIVTKYNSYTNNFYGTVDNKTELDLDDDAAYMNWGEGWCMPSEDQLTELRDNCDWTWTHKNGKDGYEVKSKINDASIFLPAAGYRLDDNLNDVGIYGTYWSRSQYTNMPFWAYDTDFRSTYVHRDIYYRYYGRSVRPVRATPASR